MSLQHVDYLTFVLAKSCKLLPVMFLHVVLYRKRYPVVKYGVVAAVTGGVAVFTLYASAAAAKPNTTTKKEGGGSTSYYGLALLGVNLLFDGLTNTTQDILFARKERFGRVTSAQMMAITNAFAAGFMVIYLVVTPYIPTESLITTTRTGGAEGELSSALAFLSRHPAVWKDILGFSICGAIGQLFIFATLERFSSLLLVTVTVTRKMLTMVLSVVWYGKRLSGGQWVGVGLVFGGIVVEALLGSREKKKGKMEEEVKWKKGR